MKTETIPQIATMAPAAAQSNCSRVVRRVLFGFLCLAPALFADSVPAGLEAAFQEARHRVQPSGTAFHLDNPENRLQAEFSASGIMITHAEGTFGLRLTALGYGQHPALTGSARMRAAGTRVEYRRGRLTEWYVNDSRGLEQGFTLSEAPANPDGGPLALELAVTGDLNPVLSGNGIELQRGGHLVLQYGGLHAWDARGHELPARIELRGTRIRLLIADVGAIYPVTVDPWVQQQELASADGAASDQFGYAVSVDGNTAVIGASLKTNGGNIKQGAAYVFTRTGAVWTLQQKLIAPDGTTNDQFGTSVSLSGDTAVIGAFSKVVSGNAAQGAVYVFTRSGTVWSQQQKLTASDGGAGDRFGISVSVDGDTAVIGAYGKTVGGNIFQGAAYVFTRNGSEWNQQQKLSGADGAANDYFGFSVSVYGDTAAIGAYDKTINGNGLQGAAYVFIRNGTIWSQQQELTAADGAPNDYFGISVSVSGDTAMIGAGHKNVGGNSGQGTAYVFSRGGSVWTQQQKLIAAGGAPVDHFGLAVFVKGDTALIGAPGKQIGGSVGQGAAYVFTRSGTVWSQQQELTAGDGAASDAFGFSVSLSGSTAAVGAYAKSTGRNGNQGAAYVFQSPAASAPPAPVSVTPASGSGVGPQTFHADFSDTAGASDLNVVYLDFGTSAGAANSCFTAYVRSSNALFLLNDASTGLVAGSITPGGGGTLSNSQCTLSGAGGAVVTSGNDLIVPFSITFAPTFSGLKNIYGLAMNNSGIGSAWTALGTWTAGANLSAVSVTPNSGSGAGPRTFSAVYSDAAGVADLNVVYLDFGTTPGAASSCNAAYVRSANALFLLNDAGDGVVSGSITPGGAGTLSNTQCTLSGAGGAAAASNNNLTVPFNIAFAPSFSGAKNIYALAQNNAGANGGYQTLGTYTPTPLILGAVAVTPANSSGSGPQTFTAVFSDPNSFGDIHVVYLDFGTTPGSANSCFVAYVRPTNQLFLLDNTSLGLVPGALTPGGSGTLSNSQCTLSGVGGPVIASGNSLTVPFNITFASGFAGPKNVYGLVLNNVNVNGGFQTLGTWTVTVPVLKAVSVNPASGTGPGAQTFNAAYTDPGGAADINVVYLNFATSPGSANSCFVAYTQSTNQLNLLNDASTGLVAGSISPGGAGTLSNSQCTVSGAGGAVTPIGDGLNVPFSITFAAGFTGPKNIYGLVQNNNGANSGWQPLGTWAH